MSEPVTLGAATYTEDALTIGVSPDGLPSGTALCPAPMMIEANRQQIFARARDDMALHGRMIVSERRIRNDAFDKRGERTTMEFKFRLCRNQDEATALAKRIREILRNR